jgi:regulator of sigma E protease
VPTVTVLAERKAASGSSELIESKISLNLGFETIDVASESELEHIYSIVPRLRIETVSQRPAGIKERLMSLSGGRKKKSDATDKLQSGDIILAVGDIENPTYKEMREVTKEYDGKDMAVKILRVDANGVEKVLMVTCVPERLWDSGRVVIGIIPVFDAEHPVVAKTIAAKDGPAKLAIPSGAVITAVNGTGVSNFYDIINEIRRNAGKRVTIDYRLGEMVTGGVTFEDVDNPDFITVRSYFAESIPFEDLKRLYKAAGPIEATGMGYRRTIMFIARTYLTLKRLIGGLVSPRDLMGPVGIVSFSYRIVSEQPFIYYVYFLGLINACIAVFNFLPLPPLDGGFFAFLLVEKVKGSAVSQRVLGIIAYAGWVIIGSFFLYVTFNDIVRSFFH